ncbi:uncharacterized protein MONOS_16395 [Monocercomonoides exilis]|uniref:uncharacterized protein n=1 Tax=Monocercomonoides exilis TaxID=2049356 RepID=UPI00355A58CF|nr:hypothetical protein MONOS_16395 [Monocercomonoides exilis]|eukprot:MONOS_16395.1-p1 / transcript=MONOS_16395.1 / gene=MONOS_16395 / organism=Monocercomonoides_exilis_PA203 / gene_product=unspecified product / transcript_product=unspecified product / location=Mono_scaffold01702:412-639(+) / protein_length=76 / sequence_SO=supercontig / SO=protein_coding / is_pseudo=false
MACRRAMQSINQAPMDEGKERLWPKGSRSISLQPAQKQGKGGKLNKDKEGFESMEEAITQKQNQKQGNCMRSVAG